MGPILTLSLAHNMNQTSRLAQLQNAASMGMGAQQRVQPVFSRAHSLPEPSAMSIGSSRDGNKGQPPGGSLLGSLQPRQGNFTSPFAGFSASGPASLRAPSTHSTQSNISSHHQVSSCSRVMDKEY